MASAQPASSRFVRTALAVHALALGVIGGVFVLLRAFSLNSLTSEVIGGVGGSAAGVLAIWSSVIAARAIRAGEPWRRAYPVIALTAAELSSPFIYYGVLMLTFDERTYMMRVMWDFGLPVIVPYAALGFAAALGAALWTMHLLAARPDVGTGAVGAQTNPFQKRDSWKKGLVAFLVTGTLWTLLFIAPLHLFCAGTNPITTGDVELDIVAGWISPNRGRAESRAWQLWVCKHTPDFARDAIHTLYRNNRRVRTNLLVNGAVSADRLRSRAGHSAIETIDLALFGMRRNYPALFHEFAIKVGDGVIRTDGMEGCAARYLAEYGTSAEVDHFLSFPAGANEHFIWQFYQKMFTLDPDLALRRLKEKLRSSGDNAGRMLALSIALRRNEISDKLEVCEVAFSDAGESFRIDAVTAALDIYQVRSDSNKPVLRRIYIEALKSLSTSDLARRRILMAELASIYRRPWNFRAVPAPAPETEKKEVENAREWLRSKIGEMK